MNEDLSESQHQTLLFKWAEASVRQFPVLALLHAIPNGGKRDPRTGARMKREGVKPGVPDMFLPVRIKNANGLYIELKKDGGRLSSHQKWWIQELRQQGFCVFVARGWVEAREAICAYLCIEDK
jgi:hypothetical protein